jgi:hypothetical protein
MKFNMRKLTLAIIAQAILDLIDGHFPEAGVAQESDHAISAAEFLQNYPGILQKFHGKDLVKWKKEIEAALNDN